MRLTALMRPGAGLAVAGGLALAAAAPAMAAPGPAAVTVTISAQSKLRPVTGHVLVVFRSGPKSSVQLSGSYSGAASGDTLALFAQPFPYSSPPAQIASKQITAASGSYSFSEIPQIATKYKAEVLSGTAVQGTSPVRYVYLSPRVNVTGGHKCGRPVCHEQFTVSEIVPASAYSAESAKHWYVYFGLRLSPVREPPAPRWLNLDAKAKVGPVTKVAATQFRRTVSFSFRIGSEGYHWLWNSCSKDTVAADGVGLPGQHGCGGHRVRSSARYLG